MNRRQITVPFFEWAVLHLCPVGDARGGPWCPKTDGALSLQWAFIWHDFSWGRVWGKESCRQGKTAAGTKLSSVGCNVLGSTRALSVATSAPPFTSELVPATHPCSAVL
jgi:hypothetical protein